MSSSEEKKVFAPNLSFKKLFFIFLIISIFGAYYEQIFSLIVEYVKTGNWVWSVRRGVIYGPFNVIYGFGAIAMCALFLRKDYKWYQIILYGALLGGTFEYAFSFLQETFTHTISWDYSNRFLNINGRTTIPYMLFWGLIALFVVRVVYPKLSNLIEKIPYKIGNILFYILLVFMALNMLISWSAIIRMGLRNNDIKAYTFIGEFLDEHYPNEYLEKYFPNMSCWNEE